MSECIACGVNACDDMDGIICEECRYDLTPVDEWENEDD